MKINDDSWVVGEIGMPLTHKRHFLDVAREQKYVIMVRKTGPTCHGLLAEGDDTRGYRIHGKSCDCGRMAGFVTRDPRLNKYGLAKAGFNHDKHMEALYADKENQGWNAPATPRIQSRDRIEVALSNAWAQAPTDDHRKRLDVDHARFAPVDGVRIVAPDWYNG